MFWISSKFIFMEVGIPKGKIRSYSFFRIVRQNARHLRNIWDIFTLKMVFVWNSYLTLFFIFICYGWQSYHLYVLSGCSISHLGKRMHHGNSSLAQVLSLIPTSEKRDVSNENIKFFSGVTIILSYTSIFELSLLFLFSLTFLFDGWRYCLISLTILSAVLYLNIHVYVYILCILYISSYLIYLYLKYSPWEHISTCIMDVD